MSNFALDVNSPQGDIISSLNYVLANLNTNAITSNVIIDIVGNVLANANVVTTNSTSGQLSSVNQGTISYLYNYVNVKYANNNTGSIGFSSNCTGKSYYGIHNTNNGTISTNPADYNWSQVAGGFGTTKGLYYTPSGGGTVYFAIATTPPSSRYLPVIDNTPIYLQNLANSIVQTYNITPGAVTNVSIAANTITGNNVQPNTLTALQIADRTLSSAQIALQGITGNVIAQNTITGNLVALNTITGNLVVPGTITGNLVAANTIQGNSIVAGSITSTQIAVGTLTVANSIQSTDAVFGSYTSPGFWLDANTGTARFGSTISVGNNLAVGNNAVIGDTLVVGNNTVIGNNLAVGSNAAVGNNLTVGNNAQIGGNLQVVGLITTGNLNANTVQTTTMVPNSATYTAGYQGPYQQINTPTALYSGYDGSFYYYQTAHFANVFLSVPTTTPTITNIISGYIDLFGVATSTVNWIPQMYCGLLRFVNADLGNLTSVAGSYVTTPAYSIFSSGTNFTTQTRVAYRNPEVSIIDVYTPSTPVANVGYIFYWGSFIGVTSNTRPTISYDLQNGWGLTITNYRR